MVSFTGGIFKKKKKEGREEEEDADEGSRGVGGGEEQENLSQMGKSRHSMCNLRAVVNAFRTFSPLCTQDG